MARKRIILLNSGESRLLGIQVSRNTKHLLLLPNLFILIDFSSEVGPVELVVLKTETKKSDNDDKGIKHPLFWDYMLVFKKRKEN